MKLNFDENKLEKVKIKNKKVFQIEPPIRNKTNKEWNAIIFDKQRIGRFALFGCH